MPRHRHDREDRDADYRDWRWSWGSALVQDLDQIEYKVVGDHIVPVAMLELTRTKDLFPGPSYFRTVERDFKHRLQWRVVRHVARALNVPAALVAYNEDLSCFWVLVCFRPDDQPLKKPGQPAWTKMLPSEFRTWIERLHK